MLRGYHPSQGRLFLSHASERRLWGGMREPAVPSVFLSELPEALFGRHSSLRWYSDQARATFGSSTCVDRVSSTSLPANAVRRRNAGPSRRELVVGDQVRHTTFGIGEITHIFGSGEKVSIAVKFSGMGPKILDPRLAPIEQVGP